MLSTIAALDPEHTKTTDAFRWEPAERAPRIDMALRALTLAGVVREEDVGTLLKTLAQAGGSLDGALCALALATEEEIAAVLAGSFGARLINNIDDLDLAIAARVSFPFLRRHRVVPFRASSGETGVAIADPTDLTGAQGCAFALGAALAPCLATGGQIETLLTRLAPAEGEADVSLEDIDPAADVARLRDLASAEPAVRLCNRLIAEASKARASDIHFEPEERRYRIRFRVDGVLADRETLGFREGLAAISRLKILSNLDIAERRRPQDGRFYFPVAGRPVDLRISSTPNVRGESVVLRLLERDKTSLELKALGFCETDAELLYGLSDRPNGIILLTGPTGSGKTTTLYVLLQRLALGDKKILTIEDPVEYAVAGVAQTQVNPEIGLDFASALRSFLRHDPDIIMVGELRDLETARTAIQAALTGHLVLSTLHTNDAPSAITRLIDMGVEDFLIASTLLGVVGQRLVRQICASCGGIVGPRDISAPRCGDCGGCGFRGRVAVAEILTPDEGLKRLIKRGVSAGDLRATARDSGFTTMVEDGKKKIAAGLTTEAELQRAITF